MADHDTDADARIVSRAQIHDLKNRLTVVKGMAQLLGRQVRRADWERDRIIQRVDGLQKEVDKLEAMIEDLRHMPVLDDRLSAARSATPGAQTSGGGGVDIAF